MLTLPSGRRVGFSLDRFQQFICAQDSTKAQRIVECLQNPDDLLFVLDAVHFSLADGSPYFAGYVAADWTGYAADWPMADKEMLAAWLFSEETRFYRAEAIRHIRSLVLDRDEAPEASPFTVLGQPTLFSAPRLRQ
jgi:hypothetical protein